LEPQLVQNRDKIAGFIRQAKEQGCRAVIFPETSLYWPPGTTIAQIDAAVAELQQVVNKHDLYALVGGIYKREESERPFERLLVIAPDGQIIQTYNKMWSDRRFNDAPGLFHIDGVPCAATICADRWIRSVEELPAAAGAKVLIEISNNYGDEWIADQGWYWNVPRALRNDVYVLFVNTARENRATGNIGHGHTAAIAPDGKVIAAAGEESDKLLVADLDLSQASGKEALARRNHPMFKPFWDVGLSILTGGREASPEHTPLVSPEVELKVAAAQIACSQRIEENVKTIVNAIRTAAAQQADVVVFPELAVTGARDADISRSSQPELLRALETLQQAAKDSRVYVACGLPWRENGRRLNCAVVIGPDGSILTRYAQVVVDRPELFSPGDSTAAMWCRIKGVPCVVTIGHEALWSEIAEMAALRGAQLHLHLAYDQDITPEGQLRRRQLWANLASFRTFTATVNAASPAGLSAPSAPAAGGSVIWDDLHRHNKRKRPVGYWPYSAERRAEAEHSPTILYATETVMKTNPQFQILTDKTNPQMTPWYAKGAEVIHTTK
jgi:predicted amidohydrolase